MTLDLDALRRYALAHSLFPPTSLAKAIARLGFVQADPIRAPARAQDLTLRHRVRDYRAGDLERLYERLEVEEDFFVNYGFVPRSYHALMHPRAARKPWSKTTTRRANDLLAFVRARGAVHPREVDAHFAHGKVVNYWGGSSNATTHLLDAMHYRGLLRVVRRDNGIRVYGVRDVASETLEASVRSARLDALIDVVVGTYAPMPAPSLSALIGRMRYGTPQWRSDLKAAVRRAKQRLSSGAIGGLTWYWPAGEDPREAALSEDSLRLLAPFDPVVWDRRRFEAFWSWGYRFEAYTPVNKRRFGYYALPLLWRDRVIGWGNLSVEAGALKHELGFVSGRPPREPSFKRELAAELDRMRRFLGLGAPSDG